MLEKYEYGEVSIVKCLLQGFPPVGRIPVESSAKPVTVRMSPISFERLQQLTPSLARRALAKQHA